MNRILKGALALLIATLVIIISPVPDNPAANQTLAIALIMICLWVTNAIHFGVTAIIPVVAFPIFHIVTWNGITSAYFHRLVFLFFGGFLLAEAIQKWGLHKRIALHIILAVGTGQRQLILGFMISCAFLSMWVNNTATTIMMLPIALSVVSYLRSHDILTKQSPFPTILMLSIAYSSSIGGMATIIGTAPNAFTVAYLDTHHQLDISFLQWFKFVFPLVVIALPLSYWVLTKGVFHLPKSSATNNHHLIEQELAKMHTVSQAESIICVVFSFVVLGWLFQPILNKIHPALIDATIALAGAGLLFILPSQDKKPILALQDVINIPWPIVLLIGGGLALATAIQTSGLAIYLADLLYFAKNFSFPLLLLLILLLIITLSEFSSNTATTAAFIPIIATVAQQFNIPPITLVLPATLAASCAFMLPIATPPNAIVFSSKHVTIQQMAKAGFYMNILFIAVLFLFGLISKYVFTFVP